MPGAAPIAICSNLQSLYTFTDVEPVPTQTQNSSHAEHILRNLQQKIDRMELKEKGFKAQENDLLHRDKLLKKKELDFRNNVEQVASDLYSVSTLSLCLEHLLGFHMRR